MPEDIRGTLATPIGTVLSTREDILNELAECNFIVTVGDIVTLGLLESGVYPDMSIVDYMTKRESRIDLRERFSRFEQPEIMVKNPRGTITGELWDAIEGGYRNPRKLRIVVEGEEDLASLACIALAPENTTVIYGIPNRGASIHHVDDKLRMLVKETLDTMRVQA